MSLKRLSNMVERHPERPPGEQDMRSWPFLTMVLVGVSISVPFFAFGGQLGQRAAFTTAVPAILIGSLILGLADRAAALAFNGAPIAPRA